MKKKYQVFVSSTYEDLKEERAAVTQCLLELDCMPVGMEQFPASNMSQMEYIEKMLGDCDYYILILAGRYGSTDENGIGYTEKEYDYAIENGIPVLSFVVEDIGELKSNKCESTEDGKQRLNNFREKVCSNKLVKMYTSTDNLQYEVATSLRKCIDDFPAMGWVRGDSIIIPEGIEAKIEKYIEDHAMTKSDIDKLFPVEDETLIIAKDNKK